MDYKTPKKILGIFKRKWQSVKIVSVIVTVVSKDIQMPMVYVRAKNVIVILKGLQ